MEIWKTQGFMLILLLWEYLVYGFRIIKYFDDKYCRNLLVFLNSYTHLKHCYKIVKEVTADQLDAEIMLKYAVLWRNNNC